MWDVVIVGAGPAGLGAALLLARGGRRVLVCDSGSPRNAASHAVHGFLTRDGIAPAELRRLARAEVERYPSAEVRDARVASAGRHDGGFEVVLDGEERLECRRLLLATGVADRLPVMPGFDAFYGRGAFHCPYCDGWEVRGQPLAAYGRGEAGLELALELTGWSPDVVLVSDGPAALGPRQRRRLARHGIAVREERVARLEGERGLERVAFVGGPPLPRRALFFNLGWRQRSDLAARLGCRFTRKGAVKASRSGETDVPGLYVAGDAAGSGQALIAAGDAARAALAINRDLLKEDLGRREDAVLPGGRAG